MPILRVGKKEDTGSYGSLSIISVSGKVTQQIFVEAMCKHMKDER